MKDEVARMTSNGRENSWQTIKTSLRVFLRHTPRLMSLLDDYEVFNIGFVANIAC
jgi:hypothetical protein